MNYNEYFQYLGDTIDELIKHAEKAILQKTTPQRYNEIKKEIQIYLNHFKNMKLQNPDKSIDDHVGAILFSYMLNPDLNLVDRDAHYNGVWYAMWGDIKKQKIDEIKQMCSNKNPINKKWTDICLSAIDEYYISTDKTFLFEQKSKKH